MKYVVLGAGPIGGGLAARLEIAGEDVWLVDPNKAHTGAIIKNGLKTTIVENNRPIMTKNLPIKAALTAQDVGRADIAVLSTKSNFTRAAVANLKLVSDANTIILSNQNGLGNLDILKESFPPEQLAYSVVQYGGDRPADGEIHTSASPGNNHLQVTSENPALRPALEEMAAALSQTGLRMTYHPKAELDRLLWKKLTANCALNGACALCQCTMDGFFSCQEGVDLASQIVAECCAVAGGLGIALSPEDIAMVETSVKEKRTVGYRHFPSMVADVANRRATEDEFLNGAIVREGRKLGIPTPYNAAVSLLLRIAQHNYDYRFGDHDHSQRQTHS